MFHAYALKFDVTGNLEKFSVQGLACQLDVYFHRGRQTRLLVTYYTTVYILVYVPATLHVPFHHTPTLSSYMSNQDQIAVIRVLRATRDIWMGSPTATRPTSHNHHRHSCELTGKLNILQNHRVCHRERPTRHLSRALRACSAVHRTRRSPVRVRSSMGHRRRREAGLAAREAVAVNQGRPAHVVRHARPRPTVRPAGDRTRAGARSRLPSPFWARGFFARTCFSLSVRQTARGAALPPGGDAGG